MLLPALAYQAGERDLHAGWCEDHLKALLAEVGLTQEDQGTPLYEGIREYWRRGLRDARVARARRLIAADAANGEGR